MTNYRKRYIVVGKIYASDDVYYWECLSKKPMIELKAEVELSFRRFFTRFWGDEYAELAVREVDKNSDYKLFDMVRVTCDA